jgi:hypothetical protein
VCICVCWGTSSTIYPERCTTLYILRFVQSTRELSFTGICKRLPHHCVSSGSEGYVDTMDICMHECYNYSTYSPVLDSSYIICTFTPCLLDLLLRISITKLCTYSAIYPDLIQHLVYPTPGLSSTWFIRHLVYPSLGLSSTWFIRHLVYPSLGLSSTWFIQHIL